jgi:hypothetical protein
MIPIDSIRIINGPDDVLKFPATAEITELGFRPGGLRIVHTKQGLWAPVDIDGKTSSPDDDQEATLWVILQINGQWFAAGMERLRPRQTDKPEPNDPMGFIAEWVSGRNFGPFNGFVPRTNDPIGFMVVAGSTRLGALLNVKERSKIIEMTYPPVAGARPVWVEGQVEVPKPDIPTPEIPKKPAEHKESRKTHVADLDTSHLATKADVDAAKAEILARIDKLEAQVKESVRQFGPALERLSGLFGSR